MITYTTKIPVSENFLQEEFIATVVKWNQGSRYDRIENVHWDGREHECRWEQDGISLEIQEIASQKIIASRLCAELQRAIYRRLGDIRDNGIYNGFLSHILPAVFR